MDPPIWPGKSRTTSSNIHSAAMWGDVALKTCQRRWTIGRSGERGSGISVSVARHDDDDDDISFSFFFISTIKLSSNALFFISSNLTGSSQSVLHSIFFYLFPLFEKQWPRLPKVHYWGGDKSGQSVCVTQFTW